MIWLDFHYFHLLFFFYLCNGIDLQEKKRNGSRLLAVANRTMPVIIINWLFFLSTPIKRLEWIELRFWSILVHTNNEIGLQVVSILKHKHIPKLLFCWNSTSYSLSSFWKFETKPKNWRWWWWWWFDWWLIYCRCCRNKSNLFTIIR